MNSLQVVCAVEGEAYVRHCAAMLHSLLVRHQDVPVQIEYLHDDRASASNRRRLASMVSALGASVTFHEVPDRWVRGLPIKGFTRKATWYRIFLDELLSEVDRALYLDTDLLVLDSLLPLWRVPLSTHLVAAVTNVPTPHDRAYTERPELRGHRYFNAGVLVLDLARIRHEGVGMQLRRHAVENATRLRWRDQDVLNEVLGDRRLALDPRWNYMNAVANFQWASDYFAADALEEARRKPAIRHFEGPSYNKPWHLLAEPVMQARYLEHRRQTPWPRVWRSGVNPVSALRYLRRRLA